MTKEQQLLDAIMDDNLETIKELLNDGVNVDTIYRYGWTPLHVAVNNEHTKVTQLLIQYKADTEAKTDTGQTPLHIAAHTGHIEAVRLLLLMKRNTNIEAQNNAGETPLHIATQKRNACIVKLLIQHNTNI